MVWGVKGKILCPAGCQNPVARITEAKEILKNLSLETKTMIVLPEGNDMIIKSFANLPKVETVVVDYMNVYDLMRFDNLVIVKDALSKIEEVYA